MRGHWTQTTGRSSLRPMPGVRCLTLPEPGSLHTGRSDTASGASEPASGEEHSRDFSKTHTDAIENMHFIFSKAPNPASQARREGERNPSSL